ncbi:UDP-N-acetylmuramate dehydrogenase [Rhizosaccharibacter radicis]|uniref:UDP-N-acetylenolpyruvoylglucosamine reductase n=1 Tax=Rhizosaccharibacter radicis TaxID=2782605 RepID=A0ABT1VY38_9PROT|nr:UDP-N-acetylmuramate dehydrogenase [Acetobacteraceae bacterium KSS12]
MSAAAARTDANAAGLASLLPAVRGRVTEQAPLGAQSWFAVGGPAELLLRPADAEDLATFLRDLPPDVPVTTIGKASNLIIRDGGLPGVCVRLQRGFSEIRPEADGVVCGAACLDMTVAEEAASAGLRGLEFLAGIPGSIGGAVAMNAGAYGSDIATVLDWAEIVTRSGELLRLPVEALGFGYRRSALPDGAVVVRARLRAEAGDPALPRARISEIRAAREASQPTRARTGGSTFRNPDPARSPLKAWELIDAAGCRGLTLGGAQVSEKHCNFLLNTGGATASDIETLGETVRRRVLETTGVELHWEIRRIGIPGIRPGAGP